MQDRQGSGGRSSRRQALAWLAAGAAAAASGVTGGASAGRLVRPAAAQAVSLFRIGTGGTGGTYYPVGSLVAEALTGALGADCAADCPDPRLLAVAQASNGSVSNVRELAAGRLEAGLAQADIAHWAHSGTGIFAGEPPMAVLRAIARLYGENLHVVARADAGIRRFADLAGKRVSLDEQGSGTLVAARLVLDAHGMSEADLNPVYVKTGLAIERVLDGRLDAFVTVAGAPVASIAALAERLPIDLVPISPSAQARIVREVPYFGAAELPAGLYPGTAAVPSLEVGALLLTRTDIPEDTIRRVTAVLWQERTHAALYAGHPKGRLIRRDGALQGLPLPLHAGAAAYYRGAGLLAPEDAPGTAGATQ